MIYCHKKYVSWNVNTYFYFCITKGVCAHSVLDGSIFYELVVTFRWGFDPGVDWLLDIHTFIFVDEGRQDCITVVKGQGF